MWSRHTTWRQTSALFAKDFQGIPELAGLADCDLMIAVSHDCDIACDDTEKEPYIEFIPAKILTSANGNFINAKNIRTLHLQHTAERIFELDAAKKKHVLKKSLINITPTDEVQLSEHNKKILQNWLAARYRRHAFPDSLRDRLIPLDDFLKKEGAKNVHDIAGYWVNYEPKNSELLADEPYEFWLQIVYASETADAHDKAAAIAKKLNETFAAMMLKSKTEGPVDLRQCEAIADTEFTLHDMRENFEYVLDYISHKATR